MIKKREIKDIIIAWLAISICFTIVLGSFDLISIISKKTEPIANLWLYLVISLIVTGTSFICHELAHKFAGIYYGAKAQFVLWPSTLLLSIGFALLVGFVFVAPGAVYIYDKQLTRKQNGLTSLAGPAINILMGLLFIIAFLILGSPHTGLASLITSYGIYINFWIAMFNLLPIGPLDGRKIFQWNPFIWGAFFISTIGLLFFL
jgi:Zn-dependent protease